MEHDLPTIRLAILNLISETLVDLSDDGSTDFDREERRDYFNRVADIIADELGLDVTGIAESGLIQGTFSPPSWA